MDNDPPAHTERQNPQPLQPGILLETVSPLENPPPYNECVQMQLTPYSYYGDDVCHGGENQNPTNVPRIKTEKFKDT